MKTCMIAAMAENGVIGANNGIPWHIPEDFKYFRQVTLGCPVIMGRKTWESLPKKPLPKRENIVISRREGYEVCGAHLRRDIWNAVDLAKKFNSKELFIIGGEQIYRLALDTKLVDKIYLTRIYKEFQGDSYFPISYLDGWKEIKGVRLGDDDIEYSFDVYERY